MVYLDDTVVFSRFLREHINNVKRVLSLFRDAEAFPKLKHYNFFIGIVDYQGRFIQPFWLEIAAHTTDAIKELKTPKNNTKHRSFMGLCNLFLCLVPIFAHIVTLFSQK